MLKELLRGSCRLPAEPHARGRANLREPTPLKKANEHAFLTEKLFLYQFGNAGD
jgi:hypothetical protein